MNINGGNLKMEFEKPIIINDHNRNKIQNALDEVQKRCTARTIDYEDILAELKAVEYQFSTVCTKKGFEGTTVLIDVNGQTFPNAYKFSAYSTQFSAVYLKSKWRLMYIGRDFCKSYNQRWYIHLSETAKQSILDSYSKDMNR